MFSLLNISKSWSKLKKEINIEKLAQFEKMQQGFGGAAPNKPEVQGVVPFKREVQVTRQSRGHKLVYVYVFATPLKK